MTHPRPGARRRRPGPVPAVTLAAALGAVLVSGLASATTGALAPRPAGSRPSPIAEEVCHQKAQTEIANAVGLHATVASPTWRDHRYACAYRYPTGTMVLSVQELSSWRQTFGYFDGLARSLHRTLPVPGLGQGAFTTRSGSVVVRKDWKVLLVDVRGLPPQFGSPPTDPTDVGLTVAGVILGCWHGD